MEKVEKLEESNSTFYSPVLKLLNNVQCHMDRGIASDVFILFESIKKFWFASRCRMGCWVWFVSDAVPRFPPS